LLGCDLGCDKASKNDAAVPYTKGRIESGIYVTNAWNEPFVRFSAGRTISILHGLGSEPEVFTWLAFFEFPFEEKSNSAESAGNQVLIEKVDAQEIQVRNDTCQDFWLRLAAIPRGEVAPGGGGQGGADGAGGSE
jgi:hypothetical protein